MLRKAHEDHAGARALLRDDGDLSYAELLQVAGQVASVLRSLGIPPGARIVIALDNRPEVAILERAIFLWGWVRVAISPRLHPEEIDYIVSDCGAELVVCENFIAPALKSRAMIVPIDPDPGFELHFGGMSEGAGPVPPMATIAPDDLASLMYTSGTTGRPKGAMNSHASWAAMASGMLSVLPPITPGDVLLHAAPMSHFSGSVSSAYIAAGGAIATLRKFDPARAIAEARRVRAACMPLVPTMLYDLVRDQERGPLIPGLNVLPYGGSTISAEVLAKARDLLGDVLLQVYGMSEALIPVTCLDAKDHRPGDHERLRLASAGRPVSGREVRLAGGQDVVGEIEVRGPNVMAGYWGRPDQTAAVLDADGWYSTGDLGRFEEGGFLRIVGRKRDMIISGGFNVYAAEVERVISELPEVSEVAVFGLPHERWGEAVAAAVVPHVHGTLAREDLLDHCRAHLAGYKKPRLVVFKDELPKTTTGKIDKRRLREDLLHSTEFVE